MTNASPETWELDYPHRGELWKATWPLAPANRPETDVEQACARGQIMAAYWLERMARAFMRVEQCTGILVEKRLVIVEHASNALDIRRIWDVQPRTPEVQAYVDRAVGCWRQCLARGVRVMEWDRPGYDEVMRAFQGLLSYASDPSVTPVVLEWEPEYRGEPTPFRAAVT